MFCFVVVLCGRGASKIVGSRENSGGQARKRERNCRRAKTPISTGNELQIFFCESNDADEEGIQIERTDVGEREPGGPAGQSGWAESARAKMALALFSLVTDDSFLVRGFFSTWRLRIREMQ